MDKLKELVTGYKLPIALTLVGVVLLGGGVYSSFTRLAPPKVMQIKLPKESVVSPETISKGITIDVSGAVKNPGVYHLDKDSRVEDALKSAGGFVNNVNKSFVAKQLNLASKLSDGAKLYIPFEGEIAPTAVLAAAAIGSTSSTSSKTNINTASQSDLEALSGVGPVTATKIINGRPYQGLEELLSKKAVTKSTYEKIKDSVEI